MLAVHHQLGKLTSQFIRSAVSDVLVDHAPGGSFEPPGEGAAAGVAADRLDASRMVPIRPQAEYRAASTVEGGNHREDAVLISVEAMHETGQRLLGLAEDHTFQARVADATQLLADCFHEGHTVYSCGNGGSMCDAMHFAEELSGRFREDRPPLAAMSISDPAHLTCVANDYGFEQVYSRFVEAHAREGDVLVALSTSGTSKNVLAAAEAMKRAGGQVLSLTGRSGSVLGDMADVDLCVDTTGYADRAQEVHIVLLHSLVQGVEDELLLSTPTTESTREP